MLNQFSRTELLFGADAMQILADSRVAVFGIGGVGGFTAEALVRSGIGAIDIIDDDKICLTNINRQIFATHKTIGVQKTDAAEERLLDINPNVKITKHNVFYTPETANDFDFTNLPLLKTLKKQVCRLYRQWVQATNSTRQRLKLPIFQKHRFALLQKLCAENVKKEELIT